MVAAEDVIDVEYSIEEAFTFIVSFGMVGKPLQRPSSCRQHRLDHGRPCLRNRPNWAEHRDPAAMRLLGEGRGGVPETSAALPCSSSCVEPRDHYPYTRIYRVVPLVTSGPQGLKDERGRARRTRAWAHEPPGRHAPWSVRMRRRDLLSVVNRRVGRPGPTPAAEAVHAGSGHRAQL
jgi:hypothetical protein